MIPPRTRDNVSLKSIHALFILTKALLLTFCLFLPQLSLAQTDPVVQADPVAQAIPSTAV